MGIRATLTQILGLVATGGTSPLVLTRQEIAWSEEAAAIADGRAALYQLYAWYYAGAQRDPTTLDFAAPALPTARPTFGAAHNLCGVVCDVLVERLNVTGFSVTADGMGEEAAKAYSAAVWRWWQRNRMDAMQVTTHTQAAVKGDAYLLVDYDPIAGMPRFTFNDAVQVTPVYDPDHTLIAAYKVWIEEWLDEQGRDHRRERVTKYEADRILKFAKEEGRAHWRIFPNDLDVAGNPDGGVLPWVDRAGQPLGVPLVHFKNRPNGEDFGRSDLADIVPAQDSYNDRHWSTDLSMRYQGDPQRYVVGIAKPPAGGWDTGPGQVWTIEASGSQPVQVGAFVPGNVAALQDATDRQMKIIAAISRTPMHLLWPEGGLPSGESLKTAEAGLVAKAKNRSVTFGNQWEDLMSLAVRVWNTFGPGPELPEDVTISTQWGSFETRSALMDEQVIASRRDDISLEQALRERGYDEETIQHIIGEKEAQTSPAQREADAFASALLARAPADAPVGEEA